MNKHLCLLSWSSSCCVPEITKTVYDQATQLYCIGTTLHVSDHSIHHQMQNSNFRSKCTL